MNIELSYMNNLAEYKKLKIELQKKNAFISKMSIYDNNGSHRKQILRAMDERDEIRRQMKHYENNKNK